MIDNSVSSEEIGKDALIRAFRYSVDVPTEEESDRVMECVQMLARGLSFDEIEVAVAIALVEIQLFDEYVDENVPNNDGEKTMH